MDNLTQLTDRKGKIATFTYDALNRPTLAQYGRSMKGQNLTAPDASVAYAWDAGDRLTQATDSQGGSLSRSYDSLDHPLSETTAQGTVSYSHDAAGHRTAMTVAGQPQVAYGYDDADRVTTITQGASQVSFSYDAAGRRATLTLPNGVTANYGYDAADQLTGLSYAQGGTPLGELTYAYDAAGRRIQTGGSLARLALPQAMSSASYDAANRLTSWAGTAHSYDANGNLTSDGAKSYGWDSRNRLASLSGAASASFVYDALGRRASKMVSGTTTNFLYDGLNPVQELSGTTPTANLLTGLGIDEYFSRTDAGGTKSFVTDALGSTLALTDAAGAIQTSYTYAPYGETTASGQGGSNAFQYTGRENDGTGLYFYRARYLDAVKGRFVSEDPIGLAGGVNLYAYAGGNPINHTDPSGLLFGGTIDAGEFYGDLAAQYWADKAINSTGIESWGYAFMGGLASLWTPCTSDTTAATLAVGAGIGRYLGRPFWQYYPAENPGFSSAWITRGWGWKPPYTPGPQAASRLGLPPWNPGTAVRPINPSPFQFVGGPTSVKPYTNTAYPGYFQPGGGIQYKIGGWPR